MDYMIVLAGVVGAIVGALIMWTIKSRPEAFQDIDWELVREMTQEFVNAAEQMHEYGSNDEKFKYALERLMEFLEERGWSNSVSDSLAKALIESAVLYL